MTTEAHHTFLTAPKAAKQLGIPYRRILKLISRGKIAAEDWSDGEQPRWRISTVEIHRLLHRRTITAKEAPVKFRSDLF